MTLIEYGQERTAPITPPPDLEAFLAGNDGTRVKLAPDVDLSDLAPRLSGLKTIEIAFPSFTDGRGFSIARQVRRMGFLGTLIASGDLIPDQHAYALQCGFDSVLVDDEIYAKQGQQDWRDALDEFSANYQRGYTTPNGPAQNIFTARKAKRSNDLKEQYDGLSAQTALTKALLKDFKGDIVLTSSMGIDSAVMLHLISEIDKDLPILFLETGKHFKETLAYRDLLVEKFGLTNFQNITPDAAQLTELDPEGDLNQSNKDACCDIRKVQPLDKVTGQYKVRITGRKRYQTRDRANISILETEGDFMRLNPLAFWTAKDVTGYMRKHNLPPHPLLAFGFLSVGCSPCTSRVNEGEDPRAGRWRDAEKDECGIHFMDGKWVRTKQPPTFHADYI
ncbi:MAG: phosphoadenylyl-sulfate reductase [Robiginitomaculum sp.]|nr:MAG: phosphoadenylyl-sulfate reductase [Robiginitomaculum sp.]